MPPTISNHPSDIFELFACKNYNQNAAKLLTVWSVLGRPFRVIAYSSPPVYGVLRHFGYSTSSASRQPDCRANLAGKDRARRKIISLTLHGARLHQRAKMSGPVKKIAVRPTSRADVHSTRRSTVPRARTRTPGVLPSNRPTDRSPFSHTNVPVDDRARRPRRTVCSATSPRFSLGRSPAPRPARSGRRCPSEPPSTASPPQRESPALVSKSVRVPVRRTLDFRKTLTVPPARLEPTGTSPARYESRTPSPNGSTTSGTTPGTPGASTSPSCTATCTPQPSTRLRTSCKTWRR